MKTRIKGFGTVMLDCGGDYKVGDPMPDGYINRQEWAQVHLDAGLKQVECCSCCLWCWPFELSDTIIKTPCIIETRVNRRKHFENSVLEDRICKKCEAKSAAKQTQPLSEKRGE